MTRNHENANLTQSKRSGVLIIIPWVPAALNVLTVNITPKQLEASLFSVSHSVIVPTIEYRSLLGLNYVCLASVYIMVCGNNKIRLDLCVNTGKKLTAVRVILSLKDILT